MQLTTFGIRSESKASHQRFVFCCGVFALSFIAFITSATFAFDDAKSASSQASLRGILPDELPDDLSEEAFAALDGSWKEWGAGAATETAKLYDSEIKDVAAQRQVLGTLRVKLDVIERALGDQRYQKLFDPLTGLYGSLLRRVDVAEAVLDTLQLDPKTAQVTQLVKARKKVERSLKNLDSMLKPMKNGSDWLDYLHADELGKLVSNAKSPRASLSVLTATHSKITGRNKLESDSQRKFLGRSQFTTLGNALDDYIKIANKTSKPDDNTKLRAELSNLVSALEGYESTNSSSSAAAARKAFNGIRSLAPDNGDRISEALQSHYFNYNLRVVASEKFLDRFMGMDRVDEGPVDDVILGAKVDGSQVTNSTVGIDLKPSGSGIRFDILLNGIVHSRTQGVTDQATIFTSGHHAFYAAKQIDFDGKKFTTHPARISVNASNTTTGASTSVSGIPLFGGIADGIAVNVARSKRDQSEAITRQRISSQVVPKFNQDVDKKFAEANKKIGPELDDPLKELGLYPSATSFRTTNDELWVSARIMSVGELAGGPPTSPVSSSKGVVLHIHESLLNNAFDRMNLAGRTVTEADLLKEIEQSFSKLLKKDVKLSSEKSDGKSKKQSTTFIFDNSDPIRFRADNGLLTLIIRTGLKQDGDDGDIPTQIITAPISIKIEGSNIVLERGKISVAPTVRPKSITKQIIFSGIVRKKIESAMPRRELDRKFDINRDKPQKPLDVAVTEIKAMDGWLTIAIE